MSIAETMLLAAIKAFAKGKRWRVKCGTCGDTHVVGEVVDLGRTLIEHAHGGEVDITIQSGTRTGPG